MIVNGLRHGLTDGNGLGQWIETDEGTDNE